MRRLSRYAQLLSGPRRSPLFDRHLAYLLVVIAGALNSVGFVAVGLYTSHMTGMTASAADHLMAGDGGLVIAAVSGIASFVLGAMVCTVVFSWGRRRRMSSRYALVLALEGMLMLIIGLLAGRFEGPETEVVLVIPLCFTMGLQNALITRIRDFPVRTTHVTGMITDLAAELGRLVCRDDGPDTRADREKLGVLSLLVALFFLGGIIGTLGYWWLGFGALVVGAVLILAAALPPILRDLRRRRVPAVRARVGA
ncbi:YoaK family protein [Kocuria palustris]|uniref:YoaK family protein n=1 Tax=Kocuria palustris TaxID=71999 RepID=UPI0011A0FCD6|nr:YoaK family protein [Kocuria palustris]